MTDPRQAKARAVRGRAVALACVAVAAVAAGLGLTIFGYIGWMIGPIVLVFGLIGRTFGKKHAFWLIWIGAGLTVGALLYIAMGLLMPDGAPTDSGSSALTPLHAPSE